MKFFRSETDKNPQGSKSLQKRTQNSSSHPLITIPSNINELNSDSGRSSRLLNFTVHGPGCPENEIWKKYIKLIEGYLDVSSILTLRQTCKILYNHKYKIAKGELQFYQFMGYDSKTIFDYILPVVFKSLHHSCQHRLRLDLSKCILMRDISIVRMLDALHRLSNKAEDDVRITNLRELNLDFCYKLSDKALEILSTTQLPFLEKLSIRCVRNKNITGIPFMRDLSPHNWPRFTHFCCSFSNIWLEPINVVADFIIHTAVNLNYNAENRLNNKLNKETRDFFSFSSIFSPSGSTNSNNANTPKNINPFQNEPISDLMDYLRNKCTLDTATKVMPNLEIFGSWGSRCLIESVGLSSHARAFSDALKEGDTVTCGKLAKSFHLEFESLCNKEEFKNNSIVQLLSNSGSELLVNSPLIVCNSEHSGVDVWTLPISIAIQNVDVQTLELLLLRGAKLNIWDYLGKSPLYRACEVERIDFVKLILSICSETTPFDESGMSALGIAIQKKNIEIVKLLLESGVELNIKSPFVKNYKSPLYIACEVNSPEIIQLLLENGADPNWRFQLKSTPTLIAYRLDSSWLEPFIKYGAGTPRENRWVLTEVLTCAITKNDINSAKYLVDMFPQLLTCEHDIWSKPHIQAAKLGNLEILKYFTRDITLLDNIDSTGNSALHVATEEGNIECIEYLISAGANINLCNKFSQNSLHLAVLENKYEAAKLLVDNKISVNQQDATQGETPLMTSIRTRNESIGLLIVNNAEDVDYSVQDSMGRNCLMYALFFGQNSIADILATKTSELNTEEIPNITSNVNSFGSDKKKLRNILKIFWPQHSTDQSKENIHDTTPLNTPQYSRAHSKQLNTSTSYTNPVIRSNSG